MLQSRDYVEARFRANSFLSMNISGGWLEPLLEGVSARAGWDRRGREGGGGEFSIALPCFFRSLSPCFHLALIRLKMKSGTRLLSSQSVYQDTMNGNRWGYIVGKRNNLLA